MKKVNNYFSHDFNARNDIKLKKVNMQMGLQGIGLYWCIIECLYENEGYLTFDDDIELLAYELRTDKEIILNLIENFDLFKKNKNKFYSPSVLERLQKITDKANKNRENVLKRWEKIKKTSKNESNTSEIQKENESNTNVLQSQYYIKEKKKKENKIKENILLTTTTTTKDNNIYSYIESNFGRTLSPIELDKIKLWLSSEQEEIIKYAISIAVMNGKSTIAYADGILKNWKSRGFTSLEEIKNDNSNTSTFNQNTDSDNDLLNYNWLEDDNDDDVSN